MAHVENQNRDYTEWVRKKIEEIRARREAFEEKRRAVKRLRMARASEQELDYYKIISGEGP